MSADSSDDKEAGGDEESVDSFASNLSALGTLVDPSLVHHVEIRKEYCRVIFSGADTGEIPFICCRGPRCRTAGHVAARKSKSTAPAGYYIALVSDDGRVLGGVPGARLTTGEMMEMMEHALATRERDRRLIEQDALEQQQNELVTFEDAVYDTPRKASTSVEDDETEQRKPQGRPSAASPDSKVASGNADTQALDAMLAMSEQMRQMNITNQALTKMLMATQPGATAPPTSVAPTVPTPAKKRSLHQRGYHAVASGKIPGIYEDKDEVRKQVQGFPFATWKSFKTYEEAQNYMLAFESANHIRDQKDLFAEQELDRTLPSSILRGQKTSSHSTKDFHSQHGNPSRPMKRHRIICLPSNWLTTSELDRTLPSSILRGQKTSSHSTGGGASFAELSKACPLCSQDQLEADCPQFKASAANRKDPPPKIYYAVAIGRTPGIYQSWGKCHTQVNRFSGNLYQGFPSFEEAYNFYITHPARDSDLLKGTGLPLTTPSLTGLGGDQGADTAKKNQGGGRGRDPPSTGRESKLFNIAVRSEGLLIDSMTPDNISPQAL
eukprot:scaffold186514_cov47-Attheya_sp.AAC.1